MIGARIRPLPLACSAGGAVLLVATLLPWYSRSLLLGPDSVETASYSGWETISAISISQVPTGTMLLAIACATRSATGMWGSARWAELSRATSSLAGGLGATVIVVLILLDPPWDEAGDAHIALTPRYGAYVALIAGLAIIVASMAELLYLKRVGGGLFAVLMEGAEDAVARSSSSPDRALDDDGSSK